MYVIYTLLGVVGFILSTIFIITLVLYFMSISDYRNSENFYKIGIRKFMRAYKSAPHKWNIMEFRCPIYEEGTKKEFFVYFNYPGWIIFFFWRNITLDKKGKTSGRLDCLQEDIDKYAAESSTNDY